MNTFANWLAEMQSSGLIGTRKTDKPKQTAAKMLGVTTNTITNLLHERVPFDVRTRLACKALLHRIEGY